MEALPSAPAVNSGGIAGATAEQKRVVKDIMDALRKNEGFVKEPPCKWMHEKNFDIHDKSLFSCTTYSKGKNGLKRKVVSATIHAQARNIAVFYFSQCLLKEQIELADFCEWCRVLLRVFCEFVEANKDKTLEKFFEAENDATEVTSFLKTVEGQLVTMQGNVMEATAFDDAPEFPLFMKTFATLYCWLPLHVDRITDHFRRAFEVHKELKANVHKWTKSKQQLIDTLARYKITHLYDFLRRSNTTSDSKLRRDTLNILLTLPRVYNTLRDLYASDAPRMRVPLNRESLSEEQLRRIQQDAKDKGGTTKQQTTRQKRGVIREAMPFKE